MSSGLDLDDRYVKHLRAVDRRAPPGPATPEPYIDLNDRYARHRRASPDKRGSPEPERRKNRNIEDFVTTPRRKKLWGEGDPVIAPVIARPKTEGVCSGRDALNGPRRPELGPSTRGLEPSGEPLGEVINELQKQPETRPISQDQLIAEVKGIYSGLVMVESRCIDVDVAQTSLGGSPDPPRLTDSQWEALISLHRALLHEHHDFLLASQHPSAGPAPRRPASEYAMPARMYRHDIHSPPVLPRHRLPDPSEYMPSFTCPAYNMMALPYETEQPSCHPGLPCFPQSTETSKARERNRDLLQARLTAQSVLGAAGDRQSVPEDWKPRGALWTKTASPSGLETEIWNLPSPLNPLGRVAASAPNLASRVALALSGTATGRAHGSPRGPKRQLLAFAAFLLLASCPAAAAWTSEQTKAALSTICMIAASSSSVGVVAVSAYGPDVNPGWPISMYACWAASFLVVAVGALIRQPTAMRRKVLVFVTLMMMIHIYGVLFAQASLSVSILVAFCPVLLVFSLFAANVLIDLLSENEIVRATLGV
ncbi:hypothetical protein RB595_006699 [Gaeumannomyces hyphopodioides]